MNRLLGLVCAGFLSLGVLSLACSSGEVVQGPLEGQAGSTGIAGSGTGVAGSSSTGVAGSSSTGVAGSSSGVAGSPGRGGSTGVAGSPGRGGSTGVAGSPGRGGSTGVAGSSSTGVAGSSSSGVAGSGSGATTCAMGLSTPPQVALITDFSDAAADASNAGEFKFGSGTASAQGGTSRFSSGTKGTLSLTGSGPTAALKYSGMTDAPGTNMYPYSGFTVYINGPACVDAHTYTGVKFTVKELTGTCDPVFGFGDSDHTAAGDDPMRGTGPAGSYGASFALTSSTTMVAFGGSAASPGSPATPVVNPAKLTGVQFQFKQKMTTATTPCTGGITVDDISFY